VHDKTLPDSLLYPCQLTYSGIMPTEVYTVFPIPTKKIQLRLSLYATGSEFEIDRSLPP
jgi:hypothetical protein